MNRYFFWLLMLAPWLTFYVNNHFFDGSGSSLFLLLNILIFNILVINIRRRHVGLSLQATLKALVPGIGYKEWQRLYFAKP